MRQHRALGFARRARRIELDRDVLRLDRHPGLVAARCVAPGRKVPPLRFAAFSGDDVFYAQQHALDVLHLRDEFRADEEHRRLAILDDERDLGPASRQFTGAITTPAFIAPINSSK